MITIPPGPLALTVTLTLGLAACGTPDAGDAAGTHAVQTQAGQRTITVVPDPAPKPPVETGDEAATP